MVVVVVFIYSGDVSQVVSMMVDVESVVLGV